MKTTECSDDLVGKTTCITSREKKRQKWVDANESGWWRRIVCTIQ